jgi:hypothetical protein
MITFFTYVLVICVIARPTDPAVINYFIRMGELFSANGENEQGKEKLETVCEELNLTKEQLNRLQKPNGTKTARAIVRACYPSSVRMNVKLEDIDDNFRQAIQGKFPPIFSM